MDCLIPLDIMIVCLLLIVWGLRHHESYVIGRIMLGKLGVGVSQTLTPHLPTTSTFHGSTLTLHSENICLSGLVYAEVWIIRV